MAKPPKPVTSDEKFEKLPTVHDADDENCEEDRTGAYWYRRANRDSLGMG